MDGNGFSLTTVSEGVLVDLDGLGVSRQTAWTAEGSDDAFLALDENENGIIEIPRELVGGAPTGPPDGFGFLAVMDGISSRGRPESVRERQPDGVIDLKDAIYDKLILWTDTNHNGRSEEDEMESLAHGRIKDISSGYRALNHTDDHGNVMVMTAQARRTSNGGVLVSRQAVTVRFAR
jgi:hypothetical protein